MPTKLDLTEARIIGSLIEKSVVTPNQYPMTLNALTNACNQKSGRNPVMALKQGELQATLRSLAVQNLVRADENFKSRTEKYVQRFCNTRYSEYQFDPAQLAIVCLLLLRGPQTPGELRSRSGRMHTFDDNSAVVMALNELMEQDLEPLVVKLPRTPGRKDSEYMHLFSGPVDAEAHAARAKAAKPANSSARTSTSDLERRVSQLESEVAALKEKLGMDG
ncbi:MAG: YceH family protein [Woeseiaceae bacterium]